MPQPQQATPNPDNYGLEFARGLLSAKQSYADAKTDEGRQAAHENAKLLRGMTNAAGIDVNGYGEGVSLKNARKNLASCEAQEIILLIITRQIFFNLHRKASA
ncbi:MAG: hypothetical protein IJL14_10150 [Selenomonadaceae bacterium]|nr:hypothetical protein [Selenomonadaceae bacterium]